VLMVVVKGVTLSSCAWARRCALLCVLYTCFKVLRFWCNCSLRLAKSGLWLFSFDLAPMVSLRIWISVRGVFAWGVGFVCLCPGGVWRWRGGVGVSMCVGVGSWGRRGH